MKTKPIIFTILSIFFLGVALAIPVQIYLIYGHGMSELSMLFAKVTYFNWMVIFACLANTILAYRASHILKYTIPISMLLVGINNWLTSHLGVDFSEVSTLSATLGFAFVTGSVAFSNGMEALNNPALRWWLIPKRVEKILPVWIEWNNQKLYLAKTFDISNCGAFISSVADMDNLPKQITAGDKITIRLGTESNEEIVCDAHVVRKATEQNGHYPKGFGIQFDQLGFKEKFQLFRLVHEAAA